MDAPSEKSRSKPNFCGSFSGSDGRNWTLSSFKRRPIPSRGRPLNAPAAFTHLCQPIVAKQPPIGPGWAHELKHDGYRLQMHVRDGRVRLYTINGADWSMLYPLIVRDAGRIESSAIIDAEVVWLDSDGMAVFDALHSRMNDAKASACV